MIRLLYCVLSVSVAMGCLGERTWVRPSSPDPLNATDEYECARDSRTFVPGRLGGTNTDRDNELFEQCMAAKGFAGEQKVSTPRTVVLVSILTTIATVIVVGAVASGIDYRNSHPPQ